MMRLCDICEDLGVRVLGMASTAHDALALFSRVSPKFILMDVHLGTQQDGVDLALEIQPLTPCSRLIYVTGSDDPETLERMQKANPHTILQKPVRPTLLAKAIQVTS